MSSTTIPDFVQRMIAGTNGNHYRNRIGKLKSLPVPRFPFASQEGQLMLDLGCGWGRWSLSAARKGWTPVGLDIKFESVQTMISLLRSEGKNAFGVVADLERLPFRSHSFSAVWSFSVIQHVHKDKAKKCFDEILRCISNSARIMIELPSAQGIWNKLRVKHLNDDPADKNSWAVRYYSRQEMKNFLEAYDSSRLTPHCFLGIGILPSDLFYVSPLFKIWVLASLFLTGLSYLFPPLQSLADSYYLTGYKKCSSSNGQSLVPSYPRTPTSQEEFYRLLICPITGESLTLDHSRTFLMNQSGTWKYPIQDGVPILLSDSAIPEV